MKTSKRIISSVLAVIMVISIMAVGAVSASAASLSKPKGVTVQNTNIAVQILWDKVSGAKKYEIYRDNKSLVTTSSLSFKDINVHGGTKYTYKVRAINGTKKSSFSSSVKIVRINSTVINTLTNEKKGIKITWPKRAGASVYQVERKATGSYTLLKSTADLNYLDETAVSGTEYTYRVTCYNTDTKAPAVASTAVSITRLAAVTNIKAVKAVDSRTVTVSWAASSGADTYNVYRQKCTDEDFELIASVKDTIYTDHNIISNPSAYRYYVTAAKNDSESVASAQRFVQTYGSTPAYFDEQRNYHVPLTFKVGDVYAEGKALSDYYSFDGNYDVTITEGSDVITIDDNVITAVKAGTAKVKLAVTESVKSIVDNEIKDALVMVLTNRDIILEITVE